MGSLFSGCGGRRTGHVDREVGLWREIIDCVEKNLQTSYRALALYFSFPLWNHSLPVRLTQFLRLTSCLNRRAQANHLIVLGRRTANTLPVATGERLRRQYQ